MEARLFKSLWVAAIAATACAGCASGRAREVDCERRATPINERPITITADRPDGGGLGQSSAGQLKEDAQ